MNAPTVTAPTLHPFRVTFGIKYRTQPHPTLPWANPDGWFTIHATNFDEACHIAYVVTGGEYANVYPDDEPVNESIYPAGRLAELSWTFPDAETDAISDELDMTIASLAIATEELDAAQREIEAGRQAAEPYLDDPDVIDQGLPAVIGDIVRQRDELLEELARVDTPDNPAVIAAYQDMLTFLTSEEATQPATYDGLNAVFQRAVGYLLAKTGTPLHMHSPIIGTTPMTIQAGDTPDSAPFFATAGTYDIDVWWTGKWWPVNSRWRYVRLGYSKMESDVVELRRSDNTWQHPTRHHLQQEDDDV